MINKVIIMGRLTADPELSQTTTGISSCKFSVAVDRGYKSANGEKQTDFIRCQAWKQTAEFVSRYFSKGKMIIVEGGLQNNNYTDANGVKHYSFVVNAESVHFGESKSSEGQASAPAQVQQTPAAAISDTVPDDIGDLSDFEAVLGVGEVPF